VEGNALLGGEGRLDRKRAERLLFEIWIGKRPTMKGKSRILTVVVHLWNKTFCGGGEEEIQKCSILAFF
jgi:hypothetical protein